MSTLKPSRIKVTQNGVLPMSPTVQIGPIFSCAGTLSASASGRFYFRASSRLVDVIVSLDTPGTTDTVVSINQNMATVRTVTLPAGVNHVHVEITSLGYSTDDYLTISVAPGSGAKDLVVETFITPGPATPGPGPL